MKNKTNASILYNYSGVNPFKDSQSRTFTDNKVLDEFCPTSVYWSLFNDQHEVLLGTRGSGKTILLKMMRFSLLKKLEHQQARALVKEKSHIGIYVPLNLEFLSSFSYQDVPDRVKIPYFQFAVNCLLAQSFLYEINSIIEEIPGFIEQAVKSVQLTSVIAPLWFPDHDLTKFSSLEDINGYINEIYYSVDFKSELKNVPRIFASPICTPIQAVSSSILPILEIDRNVNWIVCIDEAEFLEEPFQRCINTVFRSDSRGIVIKMATLPFKHTTKETLIDKVFAEANGNDFNYRLIDMKHDHADFVNVTNRLCSKRISNTIPGTGNIVTLDDFLGGCGDDDHIDYFQAEVGRDVTREEITKMMLEEFSPERKENFAKDAESETLRKSLYDKFAPIYYCREMYKASRKGNHTPGWYAGPKMIRRVSNGNPRLFIQLMNDIFEFARHNSLTIKAQHRVTYQFASRICEATKGLPVDGPRLDIILTEIAEALRSRTHGQYIIDTGNDFAISNIKEDGVIDAIQLGVQYTRISVNTSDILAGITENTVIVLSNCYCAKYWVPMRKGGKIKIKLSPPLYPNRRRKTESKGSDEKQASLFTFEEESGVTNDI